MTEQLALPDSPVTSPTGATPDPSRPAGGSLRELAASIAVPVEAGERCHAYVGAIEADDGTRAWRVYFGRDAGRQREYIGPLFPQSRQGSRLAIRLAKLIEAGGRE